jgi:hypothetical protein
VGEHASVDAGSNRSVPLERGGAAALGSSWCLLTDVDAGEDIIGVSWTHLHPNFHPANEHFDRGGVCIAAAN